MNILQLKYFCTVAKYANISRAAEEHWISQSALSKSIAALESELGVRLFERVGRNIKLNESGKAFYARIGKLLLEFDDAVKFARDTFNQSANSVKLLMSAANFSAHKIWQKCNQHLPELNLQVNSIYAATPNDIIQNDFLIFASPDEFNSMESIKLLEEDLFLVMGKNHPLAKSEEIDLIETKAFEYQVFTPNENMSKNLVLFCNKAGFQPKIGYTTVDSITFFEMLTNNSYLALMPSLSAGAVFQGEVVLKPIANPISRRSIFIGWDSSRYMSKAGSAFLEFCKTEKLFS